MSYKLRTTPYADELAEPARIFFPRSKSEGRLERLKFKHGPAKGKEGYRFSWWKDGRMLPRPLDVTESELFALLRAALQGEVFSRQSLRELRAMFKG